MVCLLVGPESPSWALVDEFWMVWTTIYIESIEILVNGEYQLILIITSPQRDSFKKSSKMGYVLLLFICPSGFKKSALWNHNLPLDRWVCTLASCFQSSLHFKRKVKKLSVKTSSASVIFSFTTLIQKNSILISSLIGNPCNPK
jgi:hypothetical protein